MPAKTEKIEAEIRKISKTEGNKVCVDCSEKMPAYVNMTHNTFVCTKCSGIHRELQFKIKGISMSTFTSEEVSMLAAGGNSNHNSRYMAKYSTSRDYALPSASSEASKLRDFIRHKYVDKRWFSESGAQTASASPAASTSSISKTSAQTKSISIAPIGTVLPSSSLRNSVALNSAGTGAGNGLIDLMNSSPTVSSSSSSTANSFDAFSATDDPFGKPVSSVAVTGIEQNFGSFDPFSSSQIGPPSAAAPSGSFASFDLNPSLSTGDIFGTGGSAAAASSSLNNAFPPPSSATFDPFSSQPTNSQGFSNLVQGQSSINHGFASANVFGGPSPISMPVPFLQTNVPVPAPAPAPVPVSVAAASSSLGDFSAFDDIAPVPKTTPSSTASSAGNPFDNAASNSSNAAAAHGPGQYGQQAYPAHVQALYQQPQPSYAGPGPVVMSVGGPLGVQYPPGPMHMLNNGTSYTPHPHMQQQFMGGHVPVSAPVPLSSQNNNPFGAPPAMPSAVPASNPIPAPVQAPVPDPFQSMGGLAWGSVGAKPPPPSNSTSSQSNAAANTPFAVQAGGGSSFFPGAAPANANNNFPIASNVSVNDHSLSQTQPVPGPGATASMNPFDLF